MGAKTKYGSELTAGDATVSDAGMDNRLGLFRCKPLDLQPILTSKPAIVSLKRQIYFKTVFLVGATQELLDSPVFARFLHYLKEAQMRPFAIYLVRKTSSKEEIESSSFYHLTMNAKLTLYPNIVLRQ